MTAIITNNGDGTHTLTFSFTAPSQRLQATADDAAHTLYDKGLYVPLDGNGQPMPWASLSVKQKADMLDAHIKQVAKDLAAYWYIQDAQDTAKTTAETDVTTRHDLG